jgi:hypothetical protein
MGQIGDYSIDLELAAVPGEAAYEATHMVLPRRARVMIARDRAAAARVMREACILEALRHPGIPRVYDCGVIADGRPWAATELVRGTPLEPTLPAAALAALVRDVATVLAYAHRRGVIHNAVWLDAIVNDSERGFPICLTSWSHARCGDPAEGAIDVRALGLAAYAAMPLCPSARLARLVDDMLAPDDDDRPSAADVASIAAGLVELAVDDLDVEEVRLVVDLSRDLPAPPPVVPAKPRWTPPSGSERVRTPSNGVPIAVLRPR